MPQVTLEVPETYSSISRPVTVGIIRDLIDCLELPNDTKIKYAGSAETLAQEGSILGKSNNSNFFPFLSKVTVDVAERYLEDVAVTTAVQRFEYAPIFNDPRLGVMLRPVYMKSEQVISIKYNVASESEALRWRDTLNRRAAQSLTTLLHELTYHYSTPYAFHVILKEIYRLRENVAGYGDSFGDWLKRHYDPRMTQLTNQSGTRVLPVIPEKQIQVEGWMSFLSGPDSIEKVKDGDEYEISFEYTVRYDKPTAMVMDYPIIVHNQMLSEDFVSKESIYNPYNQKRSPSLSGWLNDKFSVVNTDLTPNYPVFQIPEYDTWSPRARPTKLITLFSALVRIDVDNPTLVTNLMDLGQINLSQSVLNFIWRYRDKVPYYLASVFCITMYRGSFTIDPSAYYIDDDANVVTKWPMDLREVYHFRVSIVSDINCLSRKVLQSLREDPEVCIQVLDVLDCLQISKVSLADRVGGHSIAEINYPSVSEETAIVPQPRNPVSLLKLGTFNEAVSYGFLTLAVKQMTLNGIQTVLGIYLGEGCELEVNHFHQAGIDAVETLTDEELKVRYESGDYIHARNDAVGQPVTVNGMVVPNEYNTRPRRLTSPTRPLIQAPMLSDQLKILGGRYVTEGSFLDVLNTVKKNSALISANRGLFMKTVMLAGIVTHGERHALPRR